MVIYSHMCCSESVCGGRWQCCRVAAVHSPGHHILPEPGLPALAAGARHEQGIYRNTWKGKDASSLPMPCWVAGTQGECALKAVASQYSRGYFLAAERWFGLKMYWSWEAHSRNIVSKGSWEAKSQSHSMEKYLKLTGTFGNCLVQPLLQHHQLQQVDKACALLEYLQGWRLCHLPGQPVPVLDCPPHNNVFLLCFR